MPPFAVLMMLLPTRYYAFDDAHSMMDDMRLILFR